MMFWRLFPRGVWCVLYNFHAFFLASRVPSKLDLFLEAEWPFPTEEPMNRLNDLGSISPFFLFSCCLFEDLALRNAFVDS